MYQIGCSNFYKEIWVGGISATELGKFARMVENPYLLTVSDYCSIGSGLQLGLAFYMP